MIPVIALVGRPNVGKSTLFNRLTRSRDALVAGEPGLTRDRKYGTGRTGDRAYIVVDTGGLGTAREDIDSMIAGQALQAVQDADAILFIVDTREGLCAQDEHITARLRQSGKPVFVVVNKAEGMNPALACADFHALGAGEPHAISAAHGQGVTQLMDAVLDFLPAAQLNSGEPEAEQGIRVAVVGRPNVGKSTLINHILGEERVLVYDTPGTTRDSIFIPFERDGQVYTLIDTAGVRRRARVWEKIEKFSVIKTLQSIDAANVVIMLIDASEDVSEQDLNLLSYVIESGRALVIGINKWDGLGADQRERIRNSIDRKLSFAGFADIHFISALHGSGVGDVLRSVNSAYQSAFTRIPTPRLTRILEDAVSAHPPPLVHGRRIKLRYAHQGGQNPPVLVIHGNQADRVPAAYRRYLVNTFRKALKLSGTPLRIELRTGANPFGDRKNPLTRRQVEKRRRNLRRVKKWNH